MEAPTTAPTQAGAIYSAEAYSYASRFNLREIAPFFSRAKSARSTKTDLIIEYDATSVAYAYDFGALAFINVPEAEVRAVLDRFAAHFPREPHPPLHETFLIEVRPGAAIEIEMAFDRVVVPALMPTVLDVVAYLLAQSASLDYYDEDIQSMLDRIGEIAHEVAREGRPRGRQRDLLRFFGACVASEIEIISAIALLDKPDITWEDEHADTLHDKLRYHLEISERYKALEAKLITLRESLKALMEVSSEQRMLVLEIAIVVLILIEVVAGFVRIH